MKHEFEYEWEKELDQRLKNLPEKKAPDSLIANVMAEIDRRSQKAWYQQSYYQWPVAVKIASMTLFAGLGIAVFFIFNFSWNSEIVLGAKEQLGAFFQSCADFVSALGRAALVITRSFFGIYTLALMVLAFFVYGTVFGTGTLLWRHLGRGGLHVTRN